MNTLTLGQGHRKGEVFEDGSAKADRKYIDFIVSGQSLGALFAISDVDLIGAFGWVEKKEYENKLVGEFLGIEKSELETGRTSFYVCSECGDIACGAITAKIEWTDKTVIWKDFAYENNYSEPDFTNYKEIGPFTFDKTAYSNTLEQLKK